MSRGTQGLKKKGPMTHRENKRNMSPPHSSTGEQEGRRLLLKANQAALVKTGFPHGKLTILTSLKTSCEVW